LCWGSPLRIFLFQRRTQLPSWARDKRWSKLVAWSASAKAALLLLLDWLLRELCWLSPMLSPVLLDWLLPSEPWEDNTPCQRDASPKISARLSGATGDSRDDSPTHRLPRGDIYTLHVSLRCEQQTVPIVVRRESCVEMETSSRSTDDSDEAPAGEESLPDTMDEEAKTSARSEDEASVKEPLPGTT
jgi:hypothetical protein